jgi:hypothetical protein
MNEFLLIFRRELAKDKEHSPAELQASIKPWQDWLGKLAEDKKLISHGNRLHNEGKVLKAGNIVTNGPYAEIKESIGGFIVVNANDLEEATEMAKGCPILQAPWNGSVEVRMLLREDNH